MSQVIAWVTSALQKQSKQNVWGQLFQSKGSWPKLTFADSQIINFSFMAILYKHMFLDMVPFSHLNLIHS